MRIIAGRHKGRILKAPAGLATRPSGARVRQTLFDILAPHVEGARVLDLFAGGGAVGFEAHSRGAALVVLVDSAAPAHAALKANAALLGGAGLEVYRQDAETALAGFAAQRRSFDLVYLDPPYGSDLYERALERLGAPGLLAPGALVVAEHFHKRRLPETMGALIRYRSVRVGDHVLSFYRQGVT
jgi:16S rRNA (guanine(966)-N(2))-methyltransferase RsmD